MSTPTTSDSQSEKVVRACCPLTAPYAGARVHAESNDVDYVHRKRAGKGGGKGTIQSGTHARQASRLTGAA